jgi:hypothetical protein
MRDSQVVDRLVRGRAWILLLGVILIGLVGLNVSLLKLNAAAGRNAEWAKILRIENADLQARVSHLRSAQRIQDAARSMGFVMPAAADVHYLTADPGRDAGLAAGRGKFLAPPSNSDIVTAAGDSSTITAPAVAPVAAPGTTPTTATTPTTTTPTAPATTTTPAATTPTVGTGTSGATGPPAASQQPGTGATVP